MNTPILLCLCLLVSGQLAVAQYDYAQVLEYSIMFYEAQRSGKLPEDNRIPWRGDSALDDQGDNGEDLTGGYYDAGDLVKFGFPMAYSVTVLAWGLISNRAAYENAGQLEYGLASLKWGTDYFIKAHVEPTVFYGQVGDGNIDHSYWGRPEDMTMERPPFKIDQDHPGSDLAGETAAAFAATAIAFNATDPDYAATLVTHAQSMFEFANNYRGIYSQNMAGAQGFYGSSSYYDELVWAAVWLYKATGDQTYLDTAEELYQEFNLAYRAYDFGWDGKLAGAQVLLANITQKDLYVNQIIDFCDHMIYEQQRTPLGLIYISQWGTLRVASNIAWICLEASNYGFGNITDYRAFAKQQIGYALGDTGRSFVVGYGVNPPSHEHHRPSSCPSPPESCDGAQNSPDPNPHVLYGALVGGPDENDQYTDVRSDYVHNEVACDYNAGFQSTVSGLLTLEINGLI